MTGKRSVNKAACKRLAAELRAEIGLEPMDALDPWALAELYGIRCSLWAPAARARGPRPLRPLQAGGLLRRAGSRRVGRSDHRERRTPGGPSPLDMGHELAHVFGEHRFSTSLVNERGCRFYTRFKKTRRPRSRANYWCPLTLPNSWLGRRQPMKRSGSDSASAPIWHAGEWTPLVLDSSRHAVRRPTGRLPAPSPHCAIARLSDRRRALFCR